MQTQPSSIVASDDGGDGRAGGSLRGMLEGLVPLALLAVVMALGIALTLGARLATAAQGFDVEQTVAVSVAALTLLLAAILYTIACVRALRSARVWERAGNQPRAQGVLWGLALCVLLVLVPIVLAAVLPQHPAP